MRLRDWFSSLFAETPSNRAVLVDQNGRAAVPVSNGQLQNALDELIRVRHSGRGAADRSKSMRAAWSLEKLTAEKAEAWSNGKVLVLNARTAFSIWYIPGSRQIDLLPDVDDTTLGAAVNEVLSHSREITLTDWFGRIEHPDKPDLPEKMANYRAWRDKLMSRHGYKTQRALFSNMRQVTLERRAGQLQCAPTNHGKIDAWDGEGLTPDSTVIVAADSTASAIGAALRLAFDRCLDSHAQKTKSGR